MAQQLSETFIRHAAGILGDTNFGLTAAAILRVCTAYAAEFGIDLPHASQPYEAQNKRTMLAENLMTFSESQRYQLISALCDEMKGQNSDAAVKLKMQLVKQFSHLAPKDLGVSEELVEQTKHWLDPFPKALSVYKEALDKYEHKVFTRNLLDDLRLALEKVVQKLLGNAKTLESNVANLGGFLKTKGGSPELRNMLVLLIDYYTKYQNTYVKHNDAVLDEEVDVILELTSSFLKHLARLA